jgi:hypothetical protein
MFSGQWLLQSPSSFVKSLFGVWESSGRGMCKGWVRFEFIRVVYTIVGPKTYGREEHQTFYFRSVGKTTHIKVAEKRRNSVKFDNESQLKLIISDNMCIQISNKMQQ